METLALSHKANSLVDMMTGTVNSAEELAQELEDIEFLVDSGASGTVVGDQMVRAVRATDPTPNANYRLVQGYYKVTITS